MTLIRSILVAVLAATIGLGLGHWISFRVWLPSGLFVLPFALALALLLGGLAALLFNRGLKTWQAYPVLGAFGLAAFAALFAAAFAVAPDVLYPNLLPDDLGSLVVTGGAVTGIWLILDMLVRRFAPRGTGWLKADLAIAALLLLPPAIWAAAEAPVIPAAKGPSPADCALMVQVLRDRHAHAFGAGPLIYSEAGCDWEAHNLEPFVELPAEVVGLRDQPSVSIGAPRYSLLRTKAVVPVGAVWGFLVGEGEDCTYRRGLHGWRLSGCEISWMA